MDLQKLMTADYLDIVFDKRNKSYGGYELRRHYNRRVLKGLGGLILSMGALACLSFVTADKHVVQPRIMDASVNLANVQREIKMPMPVQPRVTPPPAAPKVNTAHITPPKIVNDDAVKDIDLMAKNKDLTHAVAGLSNQLGDSVDIAIAPTKVHGDITGVVTKDDKPEQPHRVVDQAPGFIGDLSAYIAAHLQYPENARSTGIEGRVVIEFIVNEDGQVSNAKVMRAIGGGCDEEAARMVIGMPKWRPGKLNGQPVKTYFSLPIKFELK